MEKRELLYEGKAKKIFATDDPDKVVLYFKDDATAFDGTKREVIADKGSLNNGISAAFFTKLTEADVPNHFVKGLSEREMLTRRVDIIPVETIYRNRAAGSLAKRLGREEGEELPFTLVDFHYKNDELHDPLINDDQAVAFGWATREELEQMRTLARRANEVLRAFLLEKGVLLVDGKLEFGRTRDGEVVVADEICPDTCRFWDAKTLEKLDKDRFRRDLGGVIEAYREIHGRLTA